MRFRLPTKRAKGGRRSSPEEWLRAKNVTEVCTLSEGKHDCCFSLDMRSLYLVFSLHGDHINYMSLKIMAAHGCNQDPFDKTLIVAYHLDFRMQITAGEFRLLDGNTLALSEVTSIAGR